MSGFRVEVGEMRSAANFVAELTEALRDGLQRVESVAADLFASGWSGVAAAAYQRAWDEWRRAAREVLAVLDEIGDALDLSAEAYAAHEHAAIAGFERIAS
jgi:6 kDa early secretory antigenic target